MSGRRSTDTTKHFKNFFSVVFRELLQQIEAMRYMGQEQLEDSDSDPGSYEREMLQDERERLHVKQDILQSHNRQLETQLFRLRQILRQVCILSVR